MIEWLNSLRSIHIESPWYLVLLPILAFAFLISFLRKRPSLIVSSISPFAASIKRKNLKFSPIKIPLIFQVVGMACFVIALMRPQNGIEETIRRTEGIDIMLALDISGSMEAFDIPKKVNDKAALAKLINSAKLKPRISVAKEEVIRFINKRSNDRIGMIAFSANTYTVCPPTLDHNFLKSNIDRLQAGMLADGTGIAAPIANATNRLKESKAKRRVIVLFTDGDNNVDAKISPLQAAKIADMFNVTVHTVGIGSDRSFVLRQGAFGRQQMISLQDSFNHKLLENISLETKGRYFAAEDAEGLRKVMQEIDKLEKTNLQQPTYIDYKELYKFYLAGGIIFVLIGYVLENTICLSIP